MASPQKENGHTQIANELLDVVVRTPLPGRHKDVWLFVLRKTWGFQKKQDFISLSQFVSGTGIDRTSICRILKDLVAWNLLAKKGSVYAIIKDYSLWVVAPRPLVGSGVAVNQVVASTPHTKETITKEINTRAKRELMKLGKYNETQSSDSYEKVITTDGDEVTESSSSVSAGVMKLVRWAEGRRGQKFNNLKKQQNAINKMVRTDITPERIMGRWEELEKDDFYRKVGMDFVTITSSFDRKP